MWHMQIVSNAIKKTSINDMKKDPIYKGQVSASSHTRYDMEMHA